MARRRELDGPPAEVAAVLRERGLFALLAVRRTGLTRWQRVVVVAARSGWGHSSCCSRRSRTDRRRASFRSRAEDRLTTGGQETTWTASTTKTRVSPGLTPLPPWP